MDKLNLMQSTAYKRMTRIEGGAGKSFQLVRAGLAAGANLSSRKKLPSFCSYKLNQILVFSNPFRRIEHEDKN
jgi:hypothetical protein